MSLWGRLWNRMPTALRLRLRKLKALPILRELTFIRLRSVKPRHAVFGYGRGGTRIGRLYIETFLDQYRADIRGVVLEIGDREYTTRFGGPGVIRSEVLHATGEGSETTIVADLTTGSGIDDAMFDCIIFTQTLQFIYDWRATVGTLERILKPGGVILATANSISQISRYDMDRWGDYWRFTSLSARRMFEEVFAPERVTVKAFGNVLTAVAVLHGMTAEEFSHRELSHHDPDYEVLIAIRAEKGPAGT